MFGCQEFSRTLARCRFALFPSRLQDAQTICPPHHMRIRIRTPTSAGAARVDRRHDAETGSHGTRTITSNSNIFTDWTAALNLVGVSWKSSFQLNHPTVQTKAQVVPWNAATLVRNAHSELCLPKVEYARSVGMRPSDSRFLSQHALQCRIEPNPNNATRIRVFGLTVSKHVH